MCVCVCARAHALAFCSKAHIYVPKHTNEEHAPTRPNTLTHSHHPPTHPPTHTHKHLWPWPSLRDEREGLSLGVCGERGRVGGHMWVCRRWISVVAMHASKQTATAVHAHTRPPPHPTPHTQKPYFHSHTSRWASRGGRSTCCGLHGRLDPALCNIACETGGVGG